MAEQPDTQPQAGENDDQPQVGRQSQQPPQQQPPAGSASEGGDAQQYSATAYKKVQSEARNLRERLRRYEDPDKGPEQSEFAQLQSRYESAVRELDDLRGKARQSAVIAALSRHGAVFPDLLATRVPEDVDPADERAMQAAVQRLRADYAGMFRTDSVDAGAGTNGRALEKDMNAIIRGALRR